MKHVLDVAASEILWGFLKVVALPMLEKEQRLENAC